MTKKRSEHRVVYADAHGLNVDTMGGDVLHSCDNPSCVRLAHLRLGTHKENMHDMIAKGRANPCSGTGHGCALLSREEVEYIKKHYRFRHPEFSGVALARKFGVSKYTVSLIVTGKTWVTGDNG